MAEAAGENWKRSWDAAWFEAAGWRPRPVRTTACGWSATCVKTCCLVATEVVSQRQAETSSASTRACRVISQHAQSLGYDALILFLDELILWLASHAADLELRQAARGRSWPSWSRPRRADRPIPLVSFVARQRDLRELVGDNVPGPSSSASATRCDWLGGPLRQDHAGRPQPAGDRREARAEARRARRPAQRARRGLRADGRGSARR